MKVNPLTLTTHISCDVPDELVGTIQRYLASVKGVDKVNVQPNGVSRRKGDAPTKMNDSSKREIIISTVQSKSQTSLMQIKMALSAAGFSPRGTGAVMKELVESKVIRRMGRGIYSAPKALPSPKKKEVANAA